MKIKEALEIPDYNQGAYVLCAIRHDQNKLTGRTTPSMRVFTKTIEVWNSLRDSDKTAKNMASAHELIILHDPTLPLEKGGRKSSEPVLLSDEQKEDIKELRLSGVDLKEISKQLGLRQKDVQPYLDTL